jgi:hypothetical protein
MAFISRFLFSVAQQTWTIVTSIVAAIWLFSSMWTALNNSVSLAHTRVDNIEAGNIRRELASDHRLNAIEGEQKVQTKMLFEIKGQLRGLSRSIEKDD